MNNLSNEERGALLEWLMRRFNLTELKNLAFALNVNYEQFRHDTMSDFCRELLLFCERHGLMGCLLREVSKLRQDDDNWLAMLLAKVPPCQNLTKVQMIVAETMLERARDLLDDLARQLGVPAEAILIIGAAWGSTRLLLSIPITAVNFTHFKQITTLANGRYHILSLEAFTFLPANVQATWAWLVVNHPPLELNGLFYTTVSWQDAQALVSKQKPSTAVSTSSSPLTPVSAHWLSHMTNQRQLLTISQQLISKLSPGEAQRLADIFPRYTTLAQQGQVETVQQAQRAFGLGGESASLAIMILSVLFTAVNLWLGQQNRQTLAELKIQQESDRVILSRLLDNALQNNRIGRAERDRLRPLLAETIAQEIGDPYSAYEHGLKKLIERVGHNLELLTYEQQLRESISQTRRYGDTATQASKRSEIIERLNQFSLQSFGQSFNDFCQIDAH